MNLLLGNQTVPVLIGSLTGGPVLSGTLDPLVPVLVGSLRDAYIHDLVLVDGNVPLYPGVDQRIDCVLRTFLGEWWLDRTQGLPYFAEMLKKNPDLSVVRQAFAAVILSVPGVRKIIKLETKFTASTRTLSVNFEVQGTDATVASGSTEVTV